MVTSLLFAAQIVCGGLVTNIVYDVPMRAPVYFGGECRTEGANAKDCCVFADIYYADGSALWAQTATFTQGTHGWEKSSDVVLPKKPVKTIKLYAFLRDGKGKAEFRNVFLERRTPPQGTALIARRYDDRPTSGGDILCECIWNGKKKVYRETAARESSGNRLPSPAKTVVWTADSMARVTPLSFPSADAARSATVELARNESESFQIVVTAGAEVTLNDVTFDISSLKDATGRTFAGTVTWERVAYLSRRPGIKSHPFAAPRHERWIPEPLLPSAPFAVRGGSSRAAWVTVRADAAAAPGDYVGEIRVVSGARLLAAVPVKVTVWSFALPARFGLATSFAYMDGFTKPLYPEDWNGRRREAHDLLLDHRLNPDDITRTDAVRTEDVAHMKSRGANAWNLMQISPPKGPKDKWLCRPALEDVFRPGFYASFTNRLAPCVAELRARGLMDGAYVYGFDECKKEYYSGMMELYGRLKHDFPDLPVLTTARMFNEVCEGKRKVSPEILSADWFCGSLNAYRPEAAETFRQHGRKVWWYTCVSPDYPYLNFANIEYPPIEGRLLLGCATWLFRADGFLFWHVNCWRAGKGLIDEAAGEFLHGWDISDTRSCPGDGVLLYPGRKHILPGIRLANIRDGEEDWELMSIAAYHVGRKAVDEIVETVCRSPKDFQRSPEALRKMRRRLAEMAEGR